jgi:hypothetical protein
MDSFIISILHQILSGVHIKKDEMGTHGGGKKYTHSFRRNT